MEREKASIIDNNAIGHFKGLRLIRLDTPKNEVESKMRTLRFMMAITSWQFSV